MYKRCPDLVPNQLANGVTRKYKFLCSTHGEYSQTLDNHMHGRRCPKCRAEKNRVDISGQRFGRLVAIEPTERRVCGSVIWKCCCACGNFCFVSLNNFRKKTHTKSCGCWEPRLTHGHSRNGQRSPEYRSWRSVVDRCTDSKNIGFERYGGANPPVLICERWRKSFETFLADLGSRPAGTSLGRYLDIGNYEPGNCVWMTPKQQTAEAKGKRAMLAYRRLRIQILEAA